MSLIDFILNLAGLLLWISWRAAPFDPLSKSRPATLPGTLRRAEPTRVRPWHFLLVLVALLVLRPFLYRLVGPSLDWTPAIKLGAIAISFRSDELWRMAFFSVASFTHILMVFYLWLVLLSLLMSRNAEPEPCSHFVRIQLGFAHAWPWFVRAVLPLVVALLLWLLPGTLLGEMGLVPRAQSWWHRMEQGIVLGLGTYLVWKYVIGAVLGLHLLNTYVYLGKHPVWSFVTAIAHRLLAPLRRFPLLVGKVDLAPVVIIAVVFILAELAENGVKGKFGLTWLFSQLPL